MYFGDADKTVEIDKSKFGKRKYNAGRAVEGQRAFRGVCRRTKQFFLVPAVSRGTEILFSALSKKKQKTKTETGTALMWLLEDL